MKLSLIIGSQNRHLSIANELIKLSGFTPEVDIPIDYVGLRPGEKMYEELITKDENITDSPHNKIMVLTNEITHGWNHVLAEAEKVINSANSYDARKIKNALHSLIPEYKQDDLEINLSVNQKKNRTHI